MPIPPLKHIIDSQNTTANISTNQVVQIAVGTVNPNSYTTQAQCRNGSKVTKLTVQLDYYSVNTAPAFFDWYIWFNIGGVQARQAPNNLNPSVTKNQVFHQDGAVSQVLQSTAVGITNVHVHKWRVTIVVPRSLQQLNENDVIELVYLGSNNAADSTVKVRVIYKEIFP